MSKLEENKKRIEPFSARDQNDEGYEQWIREQFLKEAEEIEKAVERIPDSEAWEPTEDNLQSLLGKVKEKGYIKAADNSTTNIDDETKNTEENINTKPLNNANESERKQKIINWRGSVIKWTAIAAVTVFGIFGVSMTSEANRAYIMEEVNKLFGNDVNTEVDNDKTLESDRTEEYAREEIENTLGLKIPRFFYLPSDMIYQDYAVDEEAQIGVLQFLYRDRMVYFIAWVNERTASGLAQSDTGEVIGEISNEAMPELNVILWKIEDSEDVEPTYSLRWEYKNSYYELFGKLPMEEIKAMGESFTY